MTRRCQNAYRNCPNDASADRGRAPWERLCKECLARRKERQQMTASQPVCKCGNKMAVGATQCRGCDWKDDERERELNALANEIRRRLQND